MGLQFKNGLRPSDRITLLRLSKIAKSYIRTTDLIVSYNLYIFEGRATEEGLIKEKNKAIFYYKKILGYRYYITNQTLLVENSQLYFYSYRCL